MKKIVLIFLMVVYSYAQMNFSEPKPSFDNPRKWVIQLYISEKDGVNHILSSIYNVLREYPSEAINISVVVYGKGMRVLKKDYDKATLDRVKSLMEYDVEFVACKNTMKTMNWTKDDFIDDLTYVQAGIVEVIEKVVAGYIQVTPY